MNKSSRMLGFDASHLFIFVFFTCISVVFSTSLWAHESAGSAFGESVELILDPITGLAVGVSSGPFPEVSGQTQPDFTDSDSAVSVSVEASVDILSLGLPLTIDLDVLHTGLLEVETQGDGSPSADSMATVNDVDLELLGNALYTLLVGFNADTVSSSASVAGTCGISLETTGDTILENANVSGSLAILADIAGSVTATPPANFVLLDLDLGILGRATIILNEQIVTGDGTTNASITVNAIHVMVTDLLFGSIIDIDGDIIIAQSVAEATCGEADMAITKSDNVDPIAEGQPLTYTIAVTNNGPDDADNVQVVDTLPAGMNFGSATPSQGTCQFIAGDVTCALGTITNGAGASITLVVTPTVDGLTSNTATVTSDAIDLNTDDNTATEDTTVTPVAGSANLSVTKSGSPDPVTVGELLTYTIVVTNNGPDEANNVMVSDSLPGSVIFGSAVASQGGCNEAGGTVTCNLGTIVNTGDATVTIQVTPTQAGSVNNTVVVDADEGDPDDNDNTDTDTTVVDPLQVDLTLTKSDSPDPVTVGELLTYTILVTNSGPDDANNVIVTDILPASMTFGSAVATQGGCANNSGTVSCNLGTIANSGNATVTIEVTPTADGDISNTASVVSDEEELNPDDNSDSESTTVNPVTADLTITKTDSPDPIEEGQALTYTISVSNGGPDDAENVLVIDNLPAGVNFVSAAASQGGCQHVAGVVTCALGTITNGNNAGITLVVTPTVDGLISNTATASSDAFDPNTADNSATADTTVTAAPGEADLAVTKTDSPDPVTVGETLTYLITVTNNGPDDASNVMVSDNLPGSVSYGSAVASQGSCGQAGGTVTCNLGTLTDGAGATVTIEVIPNEAGPISNTVVVDADEGDPNDSDNTATADSVVEEAVSSADLAVTKADSPDPVVEGELLTYIITVTNNGPDDAENVTAVDTLPAGVVFESVQPSQGSCQHVAGVVSCNLGTLANAANATVSIVVTPLTDGLISNTVVVDSDADDDNQADNTATEETTVSPAPGEADLSVTKSDSPDPVTVGETLTYIITVTNNGPDEANNVMVLDDLPASVALGSAVASQGSCQEAGGMVTCNLGTLANAAIATVTIEVTPNQAGPISNTVVVDADEGDPNDANNTATADSLVEEARGSANLSVSKVDSPDPVTVGETLTYTITVTNNGPDDANNVMVTDTLPGSVTLDTYVPSQGSCQVAGATVTCNLGTIANSANATVVIEVTPNAAGSISNTVVVDSDEIDPDATDNSDTEQSNVLPGPVVVLPSVPIPTMSLTSITILILSMLFVAGVASRRRRNI